MRLLDWLLKHPQTALAGMGLLLLLAALSACGGHGGSPPHPPQAPVRTHLLGHALPNRWHMFPLPEFPTADAYVEALAVRGFNLTTIEYSPVFQPQDGPCDNVHGGRPGMHTYPRELGVLIQATRRHGMHLLINVANMNRCALRDYAGDEWMVRAMNEIITAAQGRFDDIALSPVCEPHDNDPRKARRWFDIGVRMWRAAGGTRVVAPQGWCGAEHSLCDYHPQGDKQMHELLRRGAHDKKLLTNTDGTGTFELSPDRAAVAVRLALEHEAHYSLYTWRHGGPFLPTLDAMARVIAEVGG